MSLCCFVKQAVLITFLFDLSQNVHSYASSVGMFYRVFYYLYFSNKSVDSIFKSYSTLLFDLQVTPNIPVLWETMILSVELFQK